MNNKEKFIKEIEELINKAKECQEMTFEELSEESLKYLENLKSSKNEKVELTETGKTILKFMQEKYEEVDNKFKSREIAEGTFMSPRSIPGAMMKLVSEEFVSRDNSKPIQYSITEKGINKNFD